MKSVFVQQFRRCPEVQVCYQKRSLEALSHFVTDFLVLESEMMAHDMRISCLTLEKTGEPFDIVPFLRMQALRTKPSQSSEPSSNLTSIGEKSKDQSIS